MARFTGSFDFRISTKAHHTETATEETRRSEEFNIIETIRAAEFVRTVEHDIRQSTVLAEIRRTAEHLLAGTLESGTIRRTAEHFDYVLADFISEQARAIIEVDTSQDLVLNQARVLSFLHNPRHHLLHEIRVQSKAVSFRAAESFSILFQSDSEGGSLVSQQLDYQVAPIAQVDQVIKFNWTGTFDDLTRFGLSYTINGGQEIPIDLSLPKSTNQQPTLEWKEIEAIEGDQTLEYQLQVSKEFGMFKSFVDLWIPTNSYTFNTTLDYGIYYWRVRARDKDANGNVLDEGPWSSTFEFQIVESIITSVPSTNTSDLWNHSYLLPPRQTYYIWRVSNLPTADINGNPYNYRLRINAYQFPSETGIPEQDESQSSLPFNVRHTVANPPMFLRVVYDELSHHVLMDVEINDSMGRLYQLKDFQYINRDDPSAVWIDVEEHRIIGLTTGLNSNPTSSNRGYIVWDASADADVPNYQTLNYNLRFLSEPVIRDNNFYYHLEVINEESIINLFNATKDVIFGEYSGIGKFDDFDLPYLESQAISTKDIYRDYTLPYLIPAENIDTISIEIRNEYGQFFNIESYDLGLNELQVLDGFNGAKIYSSSSNPVEFQEIVGGVKFFDLSSLVNPNLLPDVVVGFQVNVLDGIGRILQSFNTIEDLGTFRYAHNATLTDPVMPSTNELYWDENSKLLIELPNEGSYISASLNFEVITYSFEYVNSKFSFPAIWKDQTTMAPNYFNTGMIRLSKQAIANIMGVNWTPKATIKYFVRDELSNIIHESPFLEEYIPNNPIVNAYYNTSKLNDYYELMGKTPLQWFSFTGELGDGEFSINLKHDFYIYSVAFDFISSPDESITLEVYKDTKLVMSLQYRGNLNPIMFESLNTFGDVIKCKFQSRRKVIVRNLEINTMPLLETIPTVGEGIYVDTDSTDIVMNEFVIDVKQYFDRFGEDFRSIVAGTVIIPEDEAIDLFSYYGLNIKTRLIISRDPEGMDILMVRTGASGREIILQPDDLFHNNVTNVILEYKNIGTTFYEISYRDAEIIERKIGNADYWITVRSRDYWIENNLFMPIEYSPWSAFARREKANIYQLRWNIRGLNLPPTKNVYFRCRAVLNSINGDTEVPIVGFFAEANPQLKIIEAEKIATSLLKEETTKELTDLTELLDSVETNDTITFNF